MPTMKTLLEMNTASGERRVAQVFHDFCELAALAIRNVVDQDGFDARETRYLSIASGYKPGEMYRFAEVLAQLVLTLADGLSDALGHLYMSLDLGNDRLGQFFTPYELSLLAARMTTTDLALLREDRGFITVNDPACGSGGMAIATAQVIRETGFDYQTAMHVTAQDIDITAVHMAYVQLSLLHVPALVIHGNTLAREQRDLWPTPAHVVARWDERLRTLPTATPKATTNDSAQYS